MIEQTIKLLGLRYNSIWDLLRDTNYYDPAFTPIFDLGENILIKWIKYYTVKQEMKQREQDG